MADIVPIRSEPEPVVALTLTQGVRDISQRLMDGELATTPEALGVDLALVREARQALAKLEERIENEMYTAMPSKVMNLPGVGSFERKAGKDYRKPKTADILRRLVGVARRQNVDLGTGEQTKPSDEALVDVLEAACRVEGWRVTALRGYGLDIEDYFEVHPGRNRVIYIPSE